MLVKQLPYFGEERWIAIGLVDGREIRASEAGVTFPAQARNLEIHYTVVDLIGQTTVSDDLA